MTRTPSDALAPDAGDSVPGVSGRAPATPIFLDLTGRRQRRLARVGMVLAALPVMFLLSVAGALIGPAHVHRLAVPGGVPGAAHAAHLVGAEPVDDDVKVVHRPGAAASLLHDPAGAAPIACAGSPVSRYQSAVRYTDTCRVLEASKRLRS